MRIQDGFFAAAAAAVDVEALHGGDGGGLGTLQVVKGTKRKTSVVVAVAVVVRQLLLLPPSCCVVVAAVGGPGRTSPGLGCVWWAGSVPGTRPGQSAPAPWSCATSSAGSGTRSSPGTKKRTIVKKNMRKTV